jgi:tetratricopeptide (TPR) repeat protein
LYRGWASDILQSNRPDTASRYIELACRLYADKRQCPELWDIYVQKTGQAFDFNQFLVSDHVNELRSYGDYFFEKEKWTEAKQLFEKAESLQHSREVLQNLYLISEKTGEAFDFQRFSVSGTVSDLNDYANFLIGEAEFNQKWSTNWVPNYQNGLQLREKQIRLDTTAALPARMSREYTGCAHKQIFLPDGKAAEASVRRALELDPTNIYTHMLLAPALLLQGKYEEAEIEYKKWAPLPFNSLNTFRAIFLSELERMEGEGLTGIDYARARAWLEEKN